MAFPPEFLDELRARTGLADLIARRVKLTRKGREHSGLCPFHSEKTPSFTVSEEKGFYHCFGCGAHGDAIGFVMHTEGLAFPDAVERLAADAGIAVPVSTPEERQQEERRATLYQVVEAACAWFEGELAGARGKAARDYLSARGLDGDTIARFRLGFAPDGRGVLKAALMSDAISEAQLIEAGMLIRPDDGGASPDSGRASYDRFRGRIVFPITDRRGRVIAFGARALGHGQPKYLNSPDTPLFNKGRILYGVATARRAAYDTGRLIVCEGYMDVIALARAGMAEAVAPLGTAITEAQIETMWRMAPEPILCLDGDEAGRRAAARAAERALPLLAPGLSLRFATLPAGEDPDSLLAAGGKAALEEVLAAAAPLDAVIWDMEFAGRPLDTPERIAGLEKRLEMRASVITDHKVQYQYKEKFKQLMQPIIWPARGPAVGARRTPAPRRPRQPPESLARRQQQVLLAIAINHGDVLEKRIETFGSLEFSDPALDKLRQQILIIYAGMPDLDSHDLKRHLKDQGFEDVVETVLGPDVYMHAPFARPDRDVAAAGAGFDQIVFRLTEPDWRAERVAAEQAFGQDPTEENWVRFQQSINNENQNLENGSGLMDDSGAGAGRGVSSARTGS